jgi:ABC-2 type transport system permease protein
LRAILALIDGLAREFVRDRTALFFTLLFPVVFMLILGLFFSGIGGGAEYDVGVVDRDQTETSAGVVTAIRSVPGFLVTSTGAEPELAELVEGNRHVVVEIPAGFEAALAVGEAVTVRVHVDPGRTSSVQVALPIVEKVLDGFDRFRSDTPRLVQMETVSTRGLNLRMIDFVGPGIIAMSVMQLGLFGAINLVSKREKLVLKRLGATPASRSTVLLAEVIFRLMITVLQSTILITIQVLVFGVSVNELGKLVGVLLLGALAFIGVGFAASSFARTEEAMLPIVQLISLPMMFLSGIFFPIENLPEVIAPIVKALPLTYFGDGVRQLMVGGSALNAMWVNLVVLVGWVAASFVVAVRFFKWE